VTDEASRQPPRLLGKAGGRAAARARTTGGLDGEPALLHRRRARGPARGLLDRLARIWDNVHDGLGPDATCSEVPEQNDYRAYLDFLREHGHNFVRLWRWEHIRSQAGGGAFHLCMTPQPWARTGPGLAVDGKPKFDLSRLGQPAPTPFAPPFPA
jgi:hypothetical protein